MLLTVSSLEAPFLYPAQELQPLCMHFQGLPFLACRALIYSASLMFQHSPSHCSNSVWQWWNSHSYPFGTRWYLGDHLRWGRPQTDRCEDHMQGKTCLGQVCVNFPERMTTRGKKRKDSNGCLHHSGKTVKASGAQGCAPTQVQIPHLKSFAEILSIWRSWAPYTVPAVDTKPCQSSKQCQSQIVPQPRWSLALKSQSFSSASADDWANSKSRYLYESSAKLNGSRSVWISAWCSLCQSSLHLVHPPHPHLLLSERQRTEGVTCSSKSLLWTQ